MQHPISFSYDINVERTPTYRSTTGSYYGIHNSFETRMKTKDAKFGYDPSGFLPARVSKKSITITMSMAEALIQLFFKTHICLMKVSLLDWMWIKFYLTA